MADINLLPEDLKKKDNQSSSKSGGFNLDEIEFTEGEKLEKEVDARIKVPKKNKIGKWFKPKFDKFSNSKNSKNYNKVESNPPKAIISEYQDKKSLNTNLTKEENKNISLDDNISKKKLEKKKGIKAKKKKTKNKKEEKKDKKKLKKPKKKNNFLSIFKKKDKEEKKEGEFDVNLLPFGSNIPTARKMISILLIAFILSMALVFIAYFGYSLYKERVFNVYEDLEDKIVSQSNSIKKYDSFIAEIEDWEVKIKEIDSFVDRHIYWTLFFERLEENTLPGVEFTGFAGNIENVIVFEASAPDYKTVSKQWLLLREADDFINSVSIDSISLLDNGEGGVKVSFSLVVDFKEEVFLQNVK